MYARVVLTHSLGLHVGLAALDQYLYAVDARLPLAFPGWLSNAKGPFPAPRRLSRSCFITHGAFSALAALYCLHTTVMTVGRIYRSTADAGSPVYVRSTDDSNNSVLVCRVLSRVYRRSSP